MCCQRGCKCHGEAGHRCQIGRPAGRREGRKAQQFYGATTPETRAKVQQLPKVMQAGSLLARAELVKTSTDPLVLEAALRDRRQVHEALAANPALPAESARWIVNRSEDRVRLALAEATTDRDILYLLEQDDSPEVRAAARWQTAMLESGPADTTADVSYRMAHQAPVKDEDGYSSAADLTAMMPSDVYQNLDL